MNFFAGGVGPRQSKGQSTASNSNAIHSGEAILHFRSKEPAIVKMEVLRANK